MGDVKLTPELAHALVVFKGAGRHIGDTMPRTEALMAIVDYATKLELPTEVYVMAAKWEVTRR